MISREDQRAVWSFLREHRHESAAIRRRRLAELTGLTDRRVRQAVHDLTARYPICSSRTGGHFVASTLGDVERAATFYRRYAGELQERARALESAWARRGAEQIVLVGA